MAKLNITFVDELGINLNRYKAIDINTGAEYIFDLSRNGTITTQGTPLNAENMNLIIQAINNIEASYIKSIEQDANGKIIITKQDGTILDLNIANVVSQQVLCPHRYEITGNTGDEHNLAINDQQMLLDKVQGRTLVKNQLIDKANIPKSQTLNGITFTNNGDGSFTINGTATANIDFPLTIRQPMVLNHKYAVIGLSPQANEYAKSLLMTAYTQANAWNDEFAFYGNKTMIKFTKVGCEKFSLHAHIGTGKSYDNAYFKPQLIDLTAKYGAGNEPTTVEQVLNDMQGYEEYDLGSFVHSKNDLISTGRNLWDEEWEVGTISYDYGVNESSSKTIRSKNYIKVLPNTNYYFRCDRSNKSYFKVRFYDINNNYLSGGNPNTTTYTYISPANAYYMRFTMSDEYGTNYNNDICINVNDESFNGTYEPYQEDVMVVDRELKEFDYIDNKTNKKYIQSSSVMVLNGSENWAINKTAESYDNVYRFDLSGEWKLDDTEYRGSVIVNKGETTHASTFSEIINLTICFVNPNATSKITNTLYVLIPKSYLSSYDLNLFKTWLSSNNIQLIYKTSAPIVELIELPRGMAVWSNGMQIQQGTIPYLLTKTYSLSIGAQVKANIQIDKEQQDQINTLKEKHNELREEFDNTFAEQSVSRETSALIDYPSKDIAYPNQNVTVDEVRGRSLNINQQIKNGNFVNSQYWDVFTRTYSSMSVSNNTLTQTFLSSGYGYEYGLKQENFNYILNHKYLISLKIKSSKVGEYGVYFSNGVTGRRFNVTAANTWRTVNILTTCEIQTVTFILFEPLSTMAVGDTVSYQDIQIVDLTQMYEAGNEPTDVNQVLIDIDNFKVDGYLPYNLGEIVDCGFKGIKSIGVNLWNEKWETGGIDVTGVNDDTHTTRIRTVDYIKVEPNKKYYLFLNDGVTQSNLQFRFYDTNKDYIGLNDGDNLQVLTNSSFLTPKNCYYVRFATPSTYGNVYKNDICINIFNDKINKQYFPYEENIYETPQVDLKSAENVYNSLYPSKGKFVKRVGFVEDLSTLNWTYNDLYNVNIKSFWVDLDNNCKAYGASEKPNAICSKYVSNNPNKQSLGNADKSFAIYNGWGTKRLVIIDTSYTDVETFKASLQGAKLYYELETPVEYDITCPNNYKAWQYGTETQLGNFPTTITKDYSISILDQITKNVEVDKNQSDLIEKLLENDKNVDERISQNENKTNELDDSLENLKNQVEGFIGQNFDKTKLKIEQNLINTRLVYNNEIISSIQNLDVKYIPQIVFSIYQDTEYSAIEKATITNSTDMDMYVSIRGQKDHLNIFVPHGESVQTSQSFSVDNLEDYIADIEIKIYYNSTTVYNETTGYTVFENVKIINLRANITISDK